MIQFNWMSINVNLINAMLRPTSEVFFLWMRASLRCLATHNRCQVLRKYLTKNRLLIDGLYDFRKMLGNKRSRRARKVITNKWNTTIKTGKINQVQLLSKITVHVTLLMQCLQWFRWLEQILKMSKLNWKVTVYLQRIRDHQFMLTLSDRWCDAIFFSSSSISFGWKSQNFRTTWWFLRVWKKKLATMN